MRIPEHIRSLRPYVPGRPVAELERELGRVCARMADNENAWGPSPLVIDAIRGAAAGVHRYPEDSCHELRQRLSQLHGVGTDQIVFGVGSSEILSMACRAVLDRDSEVLTSAGSFVLYYLLPQILGVPAVRSPLTDDFRYDFRELAARISSRTRLVLVANPNNPTGTLADAEDIDRFIRQVPDDVLVVLDEAYLEYAEGGALPDALGYVAEGRSVLVARTFSKAYGLAGLRLGYAICRPDIAELLERVRPPFNVNTVVQAAALAAIDDRAHLSQCLSRNREGLAQLCEGMRRMGFRFAQSATNFVMMDCGEPAGGVVERLRSRGVLVRGLDPQTLPTMIRVTVGTPGENERFLEAIGAQ